MHRLIPLLLPALLTSCSPGHGLADAFDGWRWEMPCVADGPTEETCATGFGYEGNLTLDAVSGATTTSAVTVRVRGVVEHKAVDHTDYADGCWSVGGTPADDDNSTFALEISDPPETHYLNTGDSGELRTWPVDVEVTFDVTGQAVVFFTVDDGGDGLQTRNRDEAGEPVVIDGVEPAPEPYDGQFLQMDVLEIIEH